jgi:hypothetical protein
MHKIKRGLQLFIDCFVKKRTATVVYSMERSGSVVVFDSLVANGEFAITTHHLDPKKLSTGLYSGSASWASKHLILKGKKVRIISLVRNPIQSMVSYFARSDFGDRMQGTDTAASDNLSAEELVRQFVTEYLEKHRYRHHLEWFDSEFKAALDVDVYRHAFDKERGYVQFQSSPMDVLILRTELDNDQKTQRISEFLGSPNFSLLSAAKSRGLEHGTPGDQTPYAEKYALLKKDLTIPEKYLDEILGSRYVTHFFPQDYLDATRERFSC